jgi:hypothetical protein
MNKEDRNRLNDLEINIIKKRWSNMSNDSHVLQSARVRHTVQTSTRLDRFVSSYGHNILFHFNTLLYLILFYKQSK